MQTSSRRSFLGNVGTGMMAGSLFPVSSLASAGSADPSGRDPVDVQLDPLFDATELKEAPLPKIIPPSKKVGYCIVGLGHLSLQEILPAFGQAKFAKPVALVSGDAGKAKKVAAQYGIDPKNIYSYETFDQIAANKEIEAVYIVLPNSMHEEFVIRAAKAGKDILCEKPMATSSVSAQRMIDACKAAGKKLMIAYRIQYEPKNNLIKEWVRNETFGKVKIIESFHGQNQGDPGQWRQKKTLAGGGPLPDVGIYNINTTRFLLGTEPQWVSASLIQPKDDPRFKEVEESLMFQMGFPGNVIAYGGCSYGVHKSARYRCLTDKGAWFGMDPAFGYTGLQIELSQARGENEYKQQVMVADKQQFDTELDHFAECILHNTNPNTSGAEGLKDMIIIEALYQSAASGKAVTINALL